MPKRMLSIGLCVALVLTLAACTPAAPSSPPAPSAAEPAEPVVGKAKGYGGEVTATVTLDADGKIVGLLLDGPGETADIGGKAIADLPALILAAGSVEGIEAVAGATVTSGAVIAAVQNAVDPDSFPYDALASASPKETSDPAAVVSALSADGYWILALLSDVTVEEAIVVEGTFHDKNDATAKVYRKLALYAQDADRNVTASYTLTCPAGMTVLSPAFRIQNGTVKGDIFVNAEGFELVGATVDGSLTFASEAVRATAGIDENSTVTGEISIAG